MSIDLVCCALLFLSVNPAVLLPIGQAIGVDPVHFGLIMCTVITTGLLTPPVGISMYTVCSVLECSMGEYIRESTPFFLAVLLEILVLVFLPDLVLLLPRLLYGG